MDLEEKIKLIPERYHFLFKQEMFNTDTLANDKRTKRIHTLAFNKCERCGYDLTDYKIYRPEGNIKIKHPHKGFVHYYDYHKLVLCDKCVDELNGQPWI